MIERVEEGNVRGYLHSPEGWTDTVFVLAHGAGSNCNSRLLTAVASEFARAGFYALRVDLPFRQERPGGPPHPSWAARDRDGLRAAVEYVRKIGFVSVVLGGHSYGGRQASMAAAEDPGLAQHLLLLSYPLHPPRKPEQMRTAHFSVLRTAALFVHGTRDPFGSPEEMRAALPGNAELLLVDGAGHGLEPLISKPEMVIERYFQSDT